MTPGTAKTILLGRTTHPDWPSLVQAVLSHVQHAAHEALGSWLRSPSQRRVRLELAPKSTRWRACHRSQRPLQG